MDKCTSVEKKKNDFILPEVLRHFLFILPVFHAKESISYVYV